VIICPAVVCP
jgi:hypothetical protein